MHSPEGLWFYQDDTDVNVLRIACSDRCWFRDVYLSYRELPLSGITVFQTVRSGYVQTSASEVLLVQTEFRSDRINWTDPIEPEVVVDRVVYGEKKYRLLLWQSKDELYDDVVWRRQCRSDCSSPLALIVSLPGSDRKMLVSPDATAIDGPLSLPSGLRPPYKKGMFTLLQTDHGDGSLPLRTAGPVDLGLAYESLISLNPGTHALQLSKRRRDAESLEKQRRREEIRRRLRAGEPVSREEMLEVLEEDS